MDAQLLITAATTAVLLVVVLRREANRPRRALAVLCGTAVSACVDSLVRVLVDASSGGRIGLVGIALGTGAGLGAGIAAGLLIRAGRRWSGRRSLILPAIGAAAAITVTITTLSVAPHVARATGAASLAAPSAARAGAAAPVWRVRVVHRGPGYAGIPRWTIPAVLPRQDTPMDSWRPEGAPAAGRLGSVVIPGAVSHFPARPALVYLPPAALTPTPARLPVVVAFSGQSKGAGPFQLQRSADLQRMMDRIAAAHDGVAPIVVVPDQLGPGSPNPMCVDSPLGDVAAYVTRDVRHWILRHLPVATTRREWTVAGFSEGGTCAIQFGAGDSRLFGSFVDVSGELAPRNGTLAHTVDVGFHGSLAAYRAASPLHLLAEHRPFTDTRAFFAVGGADRRYGPVEPVLRRRATADGISGGIRIFPGQAHDWVLGAAGLDYGLTGLAPWWGLPGSGRT